MAGGDEVGEVFVTNGAGGLFDGLVSLGYTCGDVGLMQVERDIEARTERLYEMLVGVGFFAAKAVMDVDGAETDAEGITRRVVGGVEGEEESYGIGSAGDGRADAIAGFDIAAVEWERGGRHCVHVNCLELYTGQMFETRLATVADAGLIAEQRCRMFVDAGQGDGVSLDAMKANFEVWVRPRLEGGSYIGWLVQEDERVVAGAGMWLMDFPPHWMDAMPLRAYLLNFYVEPEFRGHGLAYALLKASVEEARRRGIKVISLHASKFGKPLYERNGFGVSNEMLLRLDDSQG